MLHGKRQSFVYIFLGKVHQEQEKSCQDWSIILEICIQLRTFVALHVFSLGPHADLNLFLWKQHSSYCGHTLWFFQKSHPSMISKCVLPEFNFFISLRKNPPQVRVTSGQKLCTEIIYIVLQTSVLSSQKKSFPLIT